MPSTLLSSLPSHYNFLNSKFLSHCTRRPAHALPACAALREDSLLPARILNILAQVKSLRQTAVGSGRHWV